MKKALLKLPLLFYFLSGRASIPGEEAFKKLKLQMWFYYLIIVFPKERSVEHNFI